MPVESGSRHARVWPGPETATRAEPPAAEAANTLARPPARGRPWLPSRRGVTPLPDASPDRCTTPGPDITSSRWLDTSPRSDGRPVGAKPALEEVPGGDGDAPATPGPPGGCSNTPSPGAANGACNPASSSLSLSRLTDTARTDAVAMAPAMSVVGMPMGDEWPDCRCCGEVLTITRACYRTISVHSEHRCLPETRRHS